MTDALLDPRPPPTSTAKPRLGFLGVGWIGRQRMQSMLATGAVEAAVVADASEEAARDAASLAPGAEIASSLDDLLAAGVDGVVIATPSALHAEQAITALGAGVAVFCQKPLGRTAAETRAVVKAARRAKRLLGVDLSYRFTQGMARIRDVVRSGGLGRVFAADLAFHNAYGPDKPWFYDPMLSGGGCVIDLGVHLVDLALWTLDFPKVVEVESALFADGEPLEGRRDAVEDYATATLRLDDGAVVRIACSWRLPVGCDAIISANFHGTDGGAGLHNLEGSFYDFTAERYLPGSYEVLASPPDDWGGRAAADWAARLAGGARFDAEAERFVAVAEVLDRIYAR